MWILPRRVRIRGYESSVLKTEGTAPDLVEQLAPIVSQEFGTIDLDAESGGTAGESATTPAVALDKLRRISVESPDAVSVQHMMASRDQFPSRISG